MTTYSRETEGLELVHKFSRQVKGRTFLLTGPTPGGVGAETLISLATESPAMLILIGRSEAKAQPTIDAIKAVNANIKIKFFAAELASLKSVRTVANAILSDAEISKIDVIFNNAAVMAHPQELTEDNLELHIAINHLSHFVLTNTIISKVIAAGPAARVINVSSSGHRWYSSGVRFDDPNFTQPSSYKEFTSYGQSKSANILFSVGLNKRLASQGIRAFSPTPGSVATGLAKHINALDSKRSAELYEEVSQSVYGTSPANLREVEPRKTTQQGWVYIENCNVITDPKIAKTWATDPELAEKCWELSEILVGQKFDI
ncbi:NAD(P)-binding protein [Xylariaceae sp. FL0255]|nr:NAD(P)-binding protein [Xylariaceae sp. FL0255]